MALYKVDSGTADLTKVAGGTLYADLPIGSWVKNDMATIPSGFLKEGDTISQSEYPELYAKYGSTVPYKADKSELSEYETFTITTSNKEIDYDGTLIVNFNPSSSTQLLNGTVSVNNVVIGNVSSSNGQQQAITVEIKKGDNVKYTGSNTGTVTGEIAYYKKSLIIKAKHTPVPADFMSKVDEAVEEANTPISTEITIDSTSGTFLKLTKVGNMVFGQISATTSNNLTITDSQILASIPEAYRTTNEVRFYVSSRTSGQYAIFRYFSNSSQLQVDTKGTGALLVPAANFSYVID